RRGNGHHAMCGAYAAVAQCDRAAEHLVDAQLGEPPNGADDVENRVDRAHLVEMDLLRRHAMNLALHRRDVGECDIGAFLYVWRSAALGDDAADLLEMSTVRLGRNGEIHLPTADLGAAHTLTRFHHSVYRQSARKRFKYLGV